MKRVRKTKSNLVIKEHNPWKFFLWLVIAMIIVSVGIALAFEMGYIEGDKFTNKSLKNIKDSQDLVRYLNNQIESLSRDNKRLRTAVARLGTQSRIDSHAHQKVRDSLVRLQRENLHLREQLDFYIKIVSPNAEYSGIRIHKFQLDQGGEKGRFHYKLTLVKIHGLKNRHRSTEGEIRMYISGRKENGTSGILTLKDISESRANNIKFSIKYLFQNEGTMKIPPGFTPQSIRVQVVPKTRRGSRGNSIEKRVDWPFRS